MTALEVAADHEFDRIVLQLLQAGAVVDSHSKVEPGSYLLM